MKSSNSDESNVSSPIVLLDKEYPEYPFFSGTGFFVALPPYSDVFFITARHCIYSSDDTYKGNPIVNYFKNGAGVEWVDFSINLTSPDFDSPYVEDVLVYVVGDVTPEKREILLKRSMTLRSQELVAGFIGRAVSTRDELVAIGYPEGDFKEINIDKMTASVRSYKLTGVVRIDVENNKRFGFCTLGYSDPPLPGFSGSPVVASKEAFKELPAVMPLGVLVTQGSFISINVATNLISEYIRRKLLRARKTGVKLGPFPTSEH